MSTTVSSNLMAANKNETTAGVLALLIPNLTYSCHCWSDKCHIKIHQSVQPAIFRHKIVNAILPIAFFFAETNQHHRNDQKTFVHLSWIWVVIF